MKKHVQIAEVLVLQFTANVYHLYLVSCSLIVILEQLMRKNEIKDLILYLRQFPIFCAIATTYSSFTRLEVETTTIIHETTITTTASPSTKTLNCYDKKKGCNLADCSQNISKALCLKTCNSCNRGDFARMLLVISK